MSETFTLPFSKIIKHQSNLAEIIVNEGEVLTLEMVNEFHDFLLDHLNEPINILVNKLYAYTYTFEAQMELGTLKEIDKIGVVVYNENAGISTQSLQDNNLRKKKWNMQVFKDYDLAFKWVN